MNKNSLLRIRDLSKDELMGILEDAQGFEVLHKDWQLPESKLVANLFFEPSTRTHYSFASAELQLVRQSCSWDVRSKTLPQRAAA